MSQNFANAVNRETRKTFTENGATAFRSTGDALADLFASAGAMRQAEPYKLCSMMDEAYAGEPLLTAKFLFYLRDIRGNRVGKGERKSFQTLLHHMACKHPEAIRPNLSFIGTVYGRFDDLFALIDTPLEEQMWEHIRTQLIDDLTNMRWNKAHPDEPQKPVSLLAKWLKSIHATNAESRTLAAKTRAGIGIRSERKYRQAIHELRQYLEVVETKMSAGEWDSINFERVPSIAMKNYRGAFERHSAANAETSPEQKDLFAEYKEKVKNGEAVIHTDTLFPYDIVAPYIDDSRKPADDILEAQWQTLPNYIDKEVNTLVMCDTSNSMNQSVCGVSALPLKAAVGLTIYFAERNHGPMHNLCMTFSRRPQFEKITGNTLCEKIHNLKQAEWGMNTNLHAAFQSILHMALENNLKPEDMPQSLIVISDMQIDQCCTTHWDFFRSMQEEYKAHGYILPHVIFWNVNAEKPTMLTDDPRRPGVQLISGLNAKTFAEIIDNSGKTTMELMLDCLNNPRYDCITIETA